MGDRRLGDDQQKEMTAETTWDDRRTLGDDQQKEMTAKTTWDDRRTFGDDQQKEMTAETTWDAVKKAAQNRVRWIAVAEEIGP